MIEIFITNLRALRKENKRLIVKRMLCHCTVGGRDCFRSFVFDSDWFLDSFIFNFDLFIFVLFSNSVSIEFNRPWTFSETSGSSIIESGRWSSFSIEKSTRERNSQTKIFAYVTYD